MFTVRAPSAGLYAAGVVALALVAWSSRAHPVAQGALEVEVVDNRLSMRATVSSEEVLLAGTAAGVSGDEAARRHGAYLLAHLRVTVDRASLPGGAIDVPSRLTTRPTYALEYRLSGEPPALIVLEQDALREVEFAPGNPWEASYVVRLTVNGRRVADGLLLSSARPLRLDCRGGAGRGRTFCEFVRHGAGHILAGYDHLLFVAAIVLGASRPWDLLKVVSAFTIAHSITLAAASLGWARLSPAAVEPVIAGSIVVMAVRNVTRPGRAHGGRTWAVAFGFGLFHGLGFAGGLVEAMDGMNGTGAAVAVAGFSVGVEAGHALVVVPAFALLSRLCGDYAGGRDRLLRQYGSAVIAGVGMVYVVAALG